MMFSFKGKSFQFWLFCMSIYLRFQGAKVASLLAMICDSASHHHLLPITDLFSKVNQ